MPSASVRLVLLPPGVNELSYEKLLTQGDPRVPGVAAVGGCPVALEHRAEFQRVYLK